MPSRGLTALMALTAALVPAAVLLGPSAGAASAPCDPVPSSTPTSAPTSAPLPPPPSTPPTSRPTAAPCPVPSATALPTGALSAAPAPVRPRPTASPRRGPRLETRSGRARAPVQFPSYRLPAGAAPAPLAQGGGVAAPLDLAVQPGGGQALDAEPGARRGGWPVPVAVGLVLLLVAAHLQTLVRRL